MSKRVHTFPRHERDLYDTPRECIGPLLYHLEIGASFIEPCVGNGCLRKHLTEADRICLGSYDLSTGVDARYAQYPETDAEYFITNPPFSEQKILHPIIRNLSRQKPTWLLHKADWAYNKENKPLLTFCRKIVAIGRVKWFPGTRCKSLENFAWYLFTRNTEPLPVFYWH